MLARLSRLIAHRTHHRLLTPKQWQAEHNAERLREIPLEDFPNGPARRAAIARALAGEEIYGYRPAFLPEHVIWHRDAGHPDGARYTPAEWARKEGYALTDGDASNVQGKVHS